MSSTEQRVIEMRRCGFTFAQIGRHLGISKGRAMRVIARYKAQLRVRT